MDYTHHAVVITLVLHEWKGKKEDTEESFYTEAVLTGEKIPTNYAGIICVPINPRNIDLMLLSEELHKSIDTLIDHLMDSDWSIKAFNLTKKH